MFIAWQVLWFEANLGSIETDFDYTAEISSQVVGKHHKMC